MPMVSLNSLTIVHEFL